MFDEMGNTLPLFAAQLCLLDVLDLFVLFYGGIPFWFLQTQGTDLQCDDQRYPLGAYTVFPRD